MDDRATKEMMTNPAKCNQRVFVGSLPTDMMTPSELKEIFEPFGEVEGVLLNKGFGFVQFADEACARDAVAACGQIMFHGRKLDVKPALPIKRPFNHFEKDRDGGNSYDHRDRRDRYQPPAKNSRYMAPAPPASADRANDCEIIVVNKAQTEYGEYIEQKLRRLGLAVDVLFPNEEVPVTRVLNNIANRGCLFAIVVNPQNEEHRSMTLNILHGPPQEHRNMPLEDAIALVSRSYDAFLLKEKTARPSEVPIVAPTSIGALNLADRHPDSMQVLLNLLAENRMLTVIQYDKIITYLQSRRELQVKVELGDAAPANLPLGGLTSTAPPSVELSLQSRIMSILQNKAAAAGNQAAAGNAAPAAANNKGPNAAAAPAKPALLTDPSVQKALTSLMQNDILRKLSEPR